MEQTVLNARDCNSEGVCRAPGEEEGDGSKEMEMGLPGKAEPGPGLFRGSPIRWTTVRPAEGIRFRLDL